MSSETKRPDHMHYDLVAVALRRLRQLEQRIKELEAEFIRGKVQ